MSERRKFAFLLPAGLLAANLMNMAGIIVLPKIIDPNQFALFSLASSVGLFLIAVFYEWNRISIMRYGVAVELEDSHRRRAVLQRANLFTTLILLAAAAMALAFGGSRYGLVAGMACIFAVSQALFEARQAFFRADFQDVAYTISIVFRAFLGFTLLCSAAYSTGSGFLVMCAWASSFALVLLFLSGFAPQAGGRGRPDWATFQFLFRFGAGVALAAVVSTLLAPLVRLLASEFLPLAESGKLMLAMDISQKVIGVLGVSINILTLQATMRAREFGHEDIVVKRVGMQFSIVFAVLLPAVTGFGLLRNEFTNLLVPPSYREVFLLNIVWCMVAAGFLGFRVFALDSIFIVLGRPYIGMSGSIATLLTTICSTFVFLALKIETTLTFSLGLCIGTIFGAAVSLFLARILCRFSIEWGNLLKIVAANGGMVFAISVFQFENGLIRIGGSIVGGGAAYLAVLFALNAFGVRQFVRSPLQRG